MLEPCSNGVNCVGAVFEPCSNRVRAVFEHVLEPFLYRVRTVLQPCLNLIRTKLELFLSPVRAVFEEW